MPASQATYFATAALPHMLRSVRRTETTCQLGYAGNANTLPTLRAAQHIEHRVLLANVAAASVAEAPQLGGAIPAGLRMCQRRHLLCIITCAPIVFAQFSNLVV